MRIFPNRSWAFTEHESTCAWFLGADEEYAPASLVLETEGRRRGESEFDALLRAATNLGLGKREAELFLSKMIVCDSIMANTDRHLRNFGFIRNIHSLAWRFAPLFDSGNSLWYDKDESAVARGDHSFTSRPFGPTPNRQLALAPRLELLEGSDLASFPEEAAETLAKGSVSGWRVDYLKAGIEERVAAVLNLL